MHSDAGIDMLKMNLVSPQLGEERGERGGWRGVSVCLTESGTLIKWNQYEYKGEKQLIPLPHVASIERDRKVSLLFILCT